MVEISSRCRSGTPPSRAARPRCQPTGSFDTTGGIGEREHGRARRIGQRRGPRADADPQGACVRASGADRFRVSRLGESIRGHGSRTRSPMAGDIARAGRGKRSTRQPVLRRPVLEWPAGGERARRPPHADTRAGGFRHDGRGSRHPFRHTPDGGRRLQSRRVDRVVRDARVAAARRDAGQIGPVVIVRA